ncbi:MAG: OmpA family protein [Bacteroidota bacterium]
MPLKENISFFLICCLILFLITNGQFTFAQKDKQLPDCPSASDEAVDLYKKSRDKKKYNYDARIKLLEQSVETDPNYAPANYELGLHWQRSADEHDAPCEKCEKYFLAVIKNCPMFHSNPYFFLGKLYFENEKYDTAIKYMKMFLDFREDDVKKYDKLRYDRFLVDAKRYINWAKFYKEVMGNPVPYDPKIVEGISTVRDEYLPFISPDNELAFFTRRLPVSDKFKAWQSESQRELFCYSERQANGKFATGTPMPVPPFNMHSNEGGATITIDNKHLYYTIVEAGNYDIYNSDFVNGAWGEVKNLGRKVNHSERWDSQPSISSDGKLLCFASDRPGGYGGVDIWKTEMDSAGNWKEATNLGPVINTNGDEKAPFLHWDSKTLYFSSGENEMGAGGHMSVGGFDIYYSKLDSSGKWTTPKNIGYPINTQGDDVGFFVSSDGKYGYFGSNNPLKTLGKSIGGFDIYYFDMPQQARPDAVAIIKGKITKEGGQEIKAVDVELKDAVTKKITKAIVDTSLGEYAVAANVQQKHNQLLIVKKDSFAFSSQLISFNDSIIEKSDNPIAVSPAKKIDIEINHIEEGKIYTINNIHFGPNRSELMDESKIILDEFIIFLQENPTINIEVHGHTDNIGDEQDNQNLSADRAFTVFEYLHNNGIEKGRIGYKGFGETKPIASNDTEEGRAKNRRTEFLIIKK